MLFQSNSDIPCVVDAKPYRIGEHHGVEAGVTSLVYMSKRESTWLRR